MLSLIKKVIISIMSIPLISGYCLLLKNQECKVRKVIIDNDYLAFSYKVKVDNCIGSCNDKDNPYFKVCLPDSVTSISVKTLDLISRKNVLKNISFHQSGKCGCLLNEKVCNNKQKWNEEKCRCECLEIKACEIGFSWNTVNCSCEIKKIARLIESKTEECDIGTDQIIKPKSFPENKTLIKDIQNYKPFIGVSISFLCVSIILSGIMVYFYLKVKNNVLRY